MTEAKTQNLCDLSFASFRNIIAAINKITELAKKIAEMGRRDNSLPDQSIEDILRIIYVSESCATILQSFGEGGFEKLKKNRFISETSCPEWRLKEILLRISKSARLITILVMSPTEKKYSKELDCYREALLFIASALHQLVTGTVCYNFMKPENNCKNMDCIVKKWTVRSHISQGKFHFAENMDINNPFEKKTKAL